MSATTPEAPKRTCNYCLGGKKVWSQITSGYEPCPDCHGTGVAKLKYLGPVIERVQMKGGEFRTCKIELWRNPDGERSFGRVLEVLS